MSHSPSYSKVPLQDPGSAPSAPPALDEDAHQGYGPPNPVYDPPPPYEAGYYGAPQGYQPSAVGPPPQPAAIPYGPPPSGVPVMYPQHPTGAPVAVPQQPVPAPVVPQATQATVVVTQTLAPGVCSVCRKGKIRDSSTFCTYLCCLFWCIFGCLPGILAYFCCCRKPKCSHCGYTV